MSGRARALLRQYYDRAQHQACFCYGPVWASANISLHVGVPPVCVRVLAPSTSEKKLVWRHVYGLPPAMP